MNSRARWSSVLVVFALGLAPLALFALDPAKSIHQFNCQSWTRQTGLPAGKINAIAQTKDGFLWLGTPNGLVRFDGVAFAEFALNQPEARGHDVRCLVGSAQGDLLVTINGGAFGRFDGEKFALLDDPAWPRENVSGKTMMETRSGAVWVGANLGVGFTKPADLGSGQFFSSAKGPSTRRVFGLCEDARGRVWAGLEGAVLVVADGTAIPLEDNSLESEVVQALAAEKSGRVWVGDGNQLRCYDAEGRRVDIPPLRASITALLVDRHGVLWIGTEQRGLIRYDKGAYSELRRLDGLANDSVTALFEDAEGSIWVGTSDGLSQLSDLKFPLFTEKEGLVRGSVHMVSPARAGGLWIAAAEGACYFDGRRGVTPVPAEVMERPFVKHIVEAKNGDVYLTDNNKVLNVMRAGRLQARIPCAKWAEALAEGPEGMLVGEGKTLWQVRGDTLEPYPFDEDQDVDFVWFENLWLARDGAIWFSNSEAIFRIEGGRSQRFAIPDCRPEDRTYFITEDVDDSFWVGTSIGLLRWKNGQFRRIDEKQGLHDNRIYAIVPDDRGGFWFDSSQGIFRASRQSLNDCADGRIPAVQCEVFDGRDAVQYTDRSDQEFSGCKTTDGRIWFPNARGVVVIDPANYFTNKVPPPVHLDRVTADGRPVSVRKASELPVGVESVELAFSAPSFIAPQKVRVRYQMEGVDKAWVEAKGKRSVLYRNLRHGRYTFRVQACNSDGVWSQRDATWAFAIPPRFFETLWFRGLVVAAVVAAFLGAYRVKTRRLLQRQRKLQAANELLEAKVAERTRELSAERDLLRTLLENAHDSIYFKDTQSRYVRAGQALAVGFGVKSPDDLIGRSDADFLSAEHARLSAADEQEVMRTGQPILGKIEHSVHADGKPLWVLTSKMPWRGKDGAIVGTFGVSKDITVIKEAERKLVEVHKQLLETSRQAGMAEVATSVLHNVGNVLNSVNVSVTVVADHVRVSKVANLPKIGAMLQEHAADLGTFLTTDPKGRAIVPYLASLGAELLAEQRLLMAELEGLGKNVEHIKEIVSMQQSYAMVSGVAETVELAEIVEDAIRINSGALDRHQVDLVRDYASRPVLTLERHKVMQILVNLIRNSKYACDDSGRTDKRITIRIAEDAEWVRLSVADNGVGIPPENLTRIFGHGFTTRKGGHGFGLHSGALSAKELGGSLTVQSDGLGTGATFIIKLPLSAPRT